MVGRSLGSALAARGATVAAVASRRIDAARRAAAEAGAAQATADVAEAARRGDVVVLAVPDGAITEVCEKAAAGGGFAPGDVAIHLSGACSSDALAAARDAGASALAFHPIQTFARPDATLFEGITCALEGDDDAAALGEALAAFLGATPVRIRAEDKALYHAALCIACNYSVALADAATQLLQQAGFGHGALGALLPLLRGTVENLARVGLPHALTGPIARGDLDTLGAHLAALEATAPALLPLYRMLGRQTIAVALRKGAIQASEAETMGRLLEREP